MTKRFGDVAAVSDFSARVNPGVVTGFLGPNGAGKTTTLRMLLGLERPTTGTATVGGSRFAELRSPARVVGAMLENPGFRARRSVERHLIIAAKANDVPLSRVGELISFVGLGNDVDTRIAALSLGMRQRLSAATALIGDPGVLVLDEPANGLDPEGIRWMRTLIRGLADEGRTVLVSSHVLSEVEQIADEILVIAHGQLKFAGTMEDLADPRTGPVIVDAADRSALSTALRNAGFEFEILRSGLTVRGSDAAAIGGITTRAGVPLTTLQQRGPTLEDVFLDLVNDRYVRPAAVPEETALFELPDASDAIAESPTDPTPTGSVADETTALPVTDATTAIPVTETFDAPVEAEAPELDAPVLDAESATPPGVDEEVSRPSTRSEIAAAAAAADAAAPDSVEASGTEQDERPLPGITGLAAVASLFHAADAPADGETDQPAAQEESADVPAAEESVDAPEDDLDATRVIDVVPTAAVADEEADDEIDAAEVSDDAEKTDGDEETDGDDGIDPAEEFFDSLTGDPASDDDDAEDGEDSDSAEPDSTEPDSAEHDSADGLPADEEASDHQR